MTPKITTAILGVFFVGLFAGHFVWGATRVEVKTTEVVYDIVANSEKCEKKGGKIVARLVDNWRLPTGLIAVNYECYVPGKVVDLK